MYITSSDLSLLNSRFISTDTNQPFQYRHLKVNMTKIEFPSFLPNLLFLPLLPISVNTHNTIPVAQTKNPGTFLFSSHSIASLSAILIGYACKIHDIHDNHEFIHFSLLHC